MSLDELRNDLVQGALIDYLKNQSDVTGELSTSDEIREDMWQGTEFVYPNIRLRLMSNAPFVDCNKALIRLSWEVYSEKQSSAEADKICGKIRLVLHNKSFSSNGLHFHLSCTDVIPAIRRDARTWRSECLMRGTVSG